MSVPRRIVTGHDASGKSVILSDAPSPKTTDIGTAAFHEIWVTEGTPVQIPADESEPTDRPIRVGPPAGGVMIRFTDMEPGAESPMHRTETLDVGIVLEGETWLLLDDGSETRVGPGDAVGQARHEPCMGQPIRSARADGVRAGRRDDHRRAAGGGRTARVLRPGPRLTVAPAARE